MYVCKSRLDHIPTKSGVRPAIPHGEEQSQSKAYDSPLASPDNCPNSPRGVNGCVSILSRTYLVHIVFK